MVRLSLISITWIRDERLLSRTVPAIRSTVMVPLVVSPSKSPVTSFTVRSPKRLRASTSPTTPSIRIDPCRPSTVTRPSTSVTSMES